MPLRFCLGNHMAEDFIAEIWTLISNICMFVLCPLLFLYRVGKMQALIYACKIDQAWMTIPPSNLMEEISPNTEALRANV